MSLENIKTEENRQDSNDKIEPIRLKSFAPPRDYSLGGRGGGRGTGLDISRTLGRGVPVIKKSFTPNLNVVRNKNTNVKTSRDTSARGRNRSDSSKSDRGKRRGGSSLIQTTGVFSEGVGVLSVKKQSGFRSYSKVKDDTTPIKRPTIKKTETMDPKTEAMLIEKLLNDSDDENDEKTDFDNIVPITLNNDKWIAFNRKFKVEKIDPDYLQPKIEEGSVESNGMAQPKLETDSHINSNLCFPSTVHEIFESAESKLFLMQLPDSLPCAEDNSIDAPSTSKTATSAKDTYGSTLRELREGQIGRMVRYKSGKCKLILGETVLDLGVGMETGFLQNIMSINTNQEERSGNMINIGPVQAKITATPDWESLFKRS